MPDLVAPVYEGRFNTLSAAYTVLALGEIHRSLAVRGALAKPTITARGPDGPLPIDSTGEAFARAQLPVAANEVTVEAANDSGAYYMVSESGFDVRVPTEPLAEGIELDRVYLNAEDEPVTRAAIGDELTVRLRIRSTQRALLNNVATTDLLPGGLEIIADSVRAHGIEHHDVREDRLVVYSAVYRSPKEVTYRVKAISPGDFVAPGAHAQAMYHRSVRGRSTAGRFVIE